MIRFLLLGTLLMLAACAQPQQESEAERPPDTVAQEPEAGADTAGRLLATADIECPSPQVVEPGEGYPHPVRTYPPDSEAPTRSVAELKAFCQNTLAFFDAPNLTPDEAASVYAALGAVLVLTDESYGMPSPDSPASTPVALRERVLLRKVDTGEYEIFYTHTGCGRTYTYSQVLRAADGTVTIHPIAEWREDYPC